MGKAFAYIRCSTDEQADSGLGLESQRRRIEGYCQMRGLELGGVFEDAGVSGGKPLASRPAGSELLSAVRKGVADVVVVLKLDRGFRNAADCLQTVEAWDRKAISLHIVDLGGNAVDTTSAAGKFMLTVLAGAAEMERNLTRERTKAALHVKQCRGERVSRFAAFGHDFAPDGHVVENTVEQAVIADIRRLRTSGMTLREVADDLTRRAIPTKNGKPQWTHQTVAAILARTSAA